MQYSLKRLLLLGATFIAFGDSWASSAIVVETQDKIVATIKKINPIYRSLAADPLKITEVTANTAGELDGAYIGTPTVSSSSYFDFDTTANTITMCNSANSTWKTYQMTSVPTSWSSSTVLDLDEILRDGNVPGGGTEWCMKISLIKTGSPANLSDTMLAAWLNKVTTTAIATTAGGTALTSTGTITSGWTVKVYLQDAAAANVATTLAPVSTTLTVPISPISGTTFGTAVNFTTTLTDLYSWNVAAGATAVPKTVNLTTTGGRAITMIAYPNRFARTTDIMGAMIAASEAMPKRIYQTGNSYMNPMDTAIDQMLDSIDASAPASVAEGLGLIAKKANAKVAIGSYTTTADTNKIGLVSIGATDITIAGASDWIVETSTSGAPLLSVTGSIGSGAKKKFSCDLTGITIVNNGNTTTLAFRAADGDGFDFLVDDATGYDGTGVAGVAAAQQSIALALLLHDKLKGITTIAKSEIVTSIDAI